ncbi:MAG: NAD(P)/FAD-dependent oxidoreductase [Candidatus Omnitrophica bacterium]|nr:NAD(P)/FAD-dependent oxidoreductase [Candidatus Omnitrophota bacterium]
MKDKTLIYDIAVIGAGAAGCMAAIRAGHLGKKIIILERNDSIGKKILLTGGGRCNLTNAAHIDTFIKKFKPTGEFLRSAFFMFSNEDLMEFFRSRGLGLKIEERLRVVCATDKAFSVIKVLRDSLKEAGIEIAYGKRIISIKLHDDYFTLAAKDGSCFYAYKVIVASGGASYKETGSSGDGADLARQLNHRIVPFTPALVPLRAKETWAHALQGISLKGVRVTFYCKNKLIGSDAGEILFTHFGVSGPIVLDASSDVLSHLKNGEIKMTIDCVPHLSIEELEKSLKARSLAKSNAQIKNILQGLLPKTMAISFLSLLSLTPAKPANQLTKIEYRLIAANLKALPLTITGALALNEGMVTAGGVSLKDINPRTMESKVVPGLYFSGEIIDCRGPSGGYNLQQAFSTGFLAATNASQSL